MPEQTPLVVALTGAAGRLAQHVRPLLAQVASEVRLCDQRAVTPQHPNETAWQCSLEDAGALGRLLDGVDVVVHFAGYPREAQWDVILPANVAGVANLWEAAREAGVRRIVYASSNHAVGMYPRSAIVGSNDAPRPDSRYGVSKVFMEAVASLYAQKLGVKAFGMRIGHCSEAPTDARMLSHWISPRDLAQLVHVGMTAEIDEAIVYGASRNSMTWWDNSRAYALGYAPQDSADAHAEALRGKTSSDPVAEFYQGGSFAAEEYNGDRSAFDAPR
ncbi:NAD(P)-dependent oxidoreductase [Cupriavidus pauculus]|uniref:NAD-dependent epimerase/dehydratase family protein n=1 Tax=Cupriavidus pauculus TaxID=82633 RepID=UPI001EE29045|nr:NAD(P)-dependent oxidoreductase [Cupriavidus pauculus]GJG95115.1 NAD(P)-dependent oxidoreductase [Cupriavidus pauculus]